MKSFKEYLAGEQGIDYFIVEMSEEQVPELALINEGRWVPSGKKDWMQRVGAENPSLKQQRHVHLARSKHVNTKSKQASWNQDGTKHDKGSFNSNIGSLGVVQSVARQALGLSSKTKLEESTKAANILTQLNESLGIGDFSVLFKLRDAE